MKINYKPHLNEHLVSTKIETNYDAVTKIKSIYEKVFNKVKESFLTHLTSIGDSTDTILEKDITLDLQALISEKITDTTFNSLKSASDVNSTPAIAKDIAGKLCQEIAFICLDKVTEYKNTTKNNISEIKGIIGALKANIDTSEIELDKSLVVVNDLWSVKDEQIKSLSEQVQRQEEEIEVLQTKIEELESENSTLQSQVLSTFQMAVNNQSQLQDKQQATTEKIDEILSTKVNSYLIDTTPLQDTAKDIK